LNDQGAFVMQTKGVLVVVSGFSGAGKGTVMKALLEKYDNYALSVSATTRSPKTEESISSSQNPSLRI